MRRALLATLFGAQVLCTTLASAGVLFGIYHDSGTNGYFDTSNVINRAPQWLSMWDYQTISNNVVVNNFAAQDSALCWGSVPGSTAACNAYGNTVTNNTFTQGSWPAAAQDIIAHAGLDPDAVSIKAPSCGDATCDPGESATSCAKDCAP